MGEWNTSIYTNDCAMDLLGEMHHKFKKGVSPIDIITEELDNLSDWRGEFQLLVLADFELFVTGKIFYTSDALKTIDDLLANDMERWEDWAESREKELLTLKQKILDSKNSTPVSRTKKEVDSWFDEQRKQDIF